MHIGLFSPAWPVDEFPSGIVTYVDQLRSELINQGHRISVFTRVAGRTNTDSRAHLIELTTLYKIRRKFSELARGGNYNRFHWGEAIAATVNRVHRDDPIDILEMEESFGWCADVQKRVSCPVVVKLHGPAFLTLIDEDRQTEMAKSKMEMEGRGLRTVAAITSPSRFTLSNTLAHYHLAPPLQRVIPNPMQAESGLEFWDSEGCEQNTILFVGRFDKLKGGDIVLRAFQKLLDYNDSLKLVFVGPDHGLTAPDRSPVFFEEFKDSLFPPERRGKIDFLGQRPRREIADLRRKAMVTIVTSRWENQCYTALEAMIQGCPVVATEVGGMNEIIENGVTGLLARSGDMDDLCAKIISLLKNPVLARQIGENARRFVSDKLSATQLVNETVAVYGDVISRAKAAKK